MHDLDTPMFSVEVEKVFRRCFVFGQAGDEIGGFLLLLPHALHPALA